jgi:phage terminase large subunit-like protein
MVSNAATEQDSAGNIKVSKRKSTEKIDGIVALIMAVDQAVRNVEFVSVWENSSYQLFVI